MVPLSHHIPKALMPFWGRPMLEHTLRLLASWGVRDVIINTHHKTEAILAFAKGYSRSAPRITVSHEPEILGSGGTLRNIEWFFDQHPFWLINADVVTDLNPARLLHAYTRHRPLATLWLHAAQGPRTVEMKNGWLTTFKSPSPGGEDSYTFCGLHLLTRRVLDYLPPEGFASVIDAYTRALKSVQRIRGETVPDAFWADIGTPERYLSAHQEAWRAHKTGGPGSTFVSSEHLKEIKRWKTKGVRIKEFAALGRAIRLTGRVEIKDSILWDGVTVRAGSRVDQAIVQVKSVVQGEARYCGLPAGEMLSAKEKETIRRLGWDETKTMAQLMPARGSARQLIRLREGAHQAMLIRYSRERKENEFYARHARFLRTVGVPVPRVLRDVPRHRFALFEDLGTHTLGDLLEGASAKQAYAYYETILRALFMLHDKGTRMALHKEVPLMPAFSKDLYRWEHNLFLECFVRGAMEDADVDLLRAELARVSAKLLLDPPVLIHCDLQSSKHYDGEKKPCIHRFSRDAYGHRGV